jgi:hypothetical protein
MSYEATTNIVDIALSVLPCIESIVIKKLKKRQVENKKNENIEKIIYAP